MAQRPLYDEIETWPPARRQEYFDRKVREAVAHAYRQCPPVREKLDRAKVRPQDLRTTRDLEKVPVTTKDELVRLQKERPPFGGFLGVPLDEVEKICISPGPLYEPEGRGERLSVMVKWMKGAGVGPGDIVLNSFSYHLVPAGLWAHEAALSLGAVVIPAGVGNTDLQVQIMKDLGVTVFSGTPSFLHTVIQRAEQQGLDIRRDFKLRKAFLGAEMYPPSLRKLFEETYGLDTRENYGTADLGVLAFQCQAKAGLHIAEENFVEVVDPQTGKQLGAGETGEVVVTPFYKTYPLLRFGTGDLSLYTDEACSCGRTSHRLVRIVGRVGQAVKVRGMFLQPWELDQVMSRFPQVARYQAVVSREKQRDNLLLKLELKDVVDQELFTLALQKDIQNLCRLKADQVEYVAPGTIPPTAKKIEDIRTWE